MNGTKVQDTIVDPVTLKPVHVIREVVRIASSEHEDGWRYGYKDTMVEGEHSIYEGEVKEPVPAPVSPANEKSVKNAKAARPTQASGWGENTPHDLG